MIPYGVIYILNLVTFTVVLLSIHRNRIELHDKPKKIAMTITVTFLLAILFGIGWVFGVLGSTGIVQPGLSRAFQVLFILIVGFHGFFIFLLYLCCSKSARNMWMKWITCSHQHLYLERIYISQHQHNHTSSMPVVSDQPVSISAQSTNAKQGGLKTSNMARRVGYKAHHSGSIYYGTNPMEKLNNPGSTRLSEFEEPNVLDTAMGEEMISNFSVAYSSFMAHGSSNLEASHSAQNDPTLAQPSFAVGVQPLRSDSFQSSFESFASPDADSHGHSPSPLYDQTIEQRLSHDQPISFSSFKPLASAPSEVDDFDQFKPRADRALKGKLDARPEPALRSGKALPPNFDPFTIQN